MQAHSLTHTANTNAHPCNTPHTHTRVHIHRDRIIGNVFCLLVGEVDRHTEPDDGNMVLEELAGLPHHLVHALPWPQQRVVWSV